MKDIYIKALKKYGIEHQTMMVFEEMAELQKELCKSLRGKDNRMEIAEEIADVLIMLDQMILLHDCENQVEIFKRQKIDRLKKDWRKNERSTSTDYIGVCGTRYEAYRGGA